jgi:hypothetical protein
VIPLDKSRRELVALLVAVYRASSGLGGLRRTTDSGAVRGRRTSAERGGHSRKVSQALMSPLL